MKQCKIRSIPEDDLDLIDASLMCDEQLARVAIHTEEHGTIVATLRRAGDEFEAEIARITATSLDRIASRSASTMDAAASAMDKASVALGLPGQPIFQAMLAAIQSSEEE